MIFLNSLSTIPLLRLKFLKNPPKKLALLKGIGSSLAWGTAIFLLSIISTKGSNPKPNHKTQKISSSLKNPIRAPDCSQKPFVLKGEQINYNPQQNYAEIKGQAWAERITAASPSSASQKQTLSADRFKVIFAPIPSSSSEDSISAGLTSAPALDSIQAQGNVKFQQGDLSLEAQTCTYYASNSQKSERIICSKHVIIQKGANVLKGDQVEADLINGTYQLKAVKPQGRVEAVVNSFPFNPQVSSPSP